MVRCDEFYEKCEKDGNFCDMSERTWSGVTRYIKEYWSALFHTGKKVPFSEAAWLKQQRKTAKAHIRQTKGLLRGEIAPTLPIAPVAPIGPTGPGCEMIETEVNGIMVPRGFHSGEPRPHRFQVLTNNTQSLYTTHAKTKHRIVMIKATNNISLHVIPEDLSGRRLIELIGFISYLTLNLRPSFFFFYIICIFLRIEFPLLVRPHITTFGRVLVLISVLKLVFQLYRSLRPPYIY